jgi:hypothetical protein
LIPFSRGVWLFECDQMLFVFEEKHNISGFVIRTFVPVDQKTLAGHSIATR